MRTSFISLLAITSLFGNSLAAPTIVGVETRAPASATDIMNNFYSQVQTHTGTINSTLNGINSGSTSAQNSTAQAAISKAVTNIISAATSTNSALKTSKRDLETRTYSALDQQIISGTSANAITSIAGTMGLVQGKFGAGYTGGLIGGLVGALGLVLGTLDAIVGDVLMLAGALVGGVLEGVGGLLVGILFGRW